MRKVQQVDVAGLTCGQRHEIADGCQCLPILVEIVLNGCAAGLAGAYMQVYNAFSDVTRINHESIGHLRIRTVGSLLVSSVSHYSHGFPRSR